MRSSTKPRGSWARFRLPRLGISLVAAAGLLAASAASMGPVTVHAAGPGSYVGVTPFRVADTRPSSGQPNAGQTIAGPGSINVQVTGLGGVPAGAAAAVLNVTAVDPTAAGFLTVWPQGSAMPTVSNLNFAAGHNVPNLVTVGLSATGQVSIYANTGSTDVVADVEGYYTSTAPTNGLGLYNPLAPTRVVGGGPWRVLAVRALHTDRLRLRLHAGHCA